ncbi:MAG: hypothetical protein ACOCYT_01360 [Chloroflexota bacterium]
MGKQVIDQGDREILLGLKIVMGVTLVAASIAALSTPFVIVVFVALVSLVKHLDKLDLTGPDQWARLFLRFVAVYTGMGVVVQAASLVSLENKTLIAFLMVISISVTIRIMQPPSTRKHPLVAG